MEDFVSKLQQRAQETQFSGVVSIVRGGNTLFNQAFGYRDIKNKLPNNTDTIFGIASGTKLFTALGIGRLIDQGKLSLDTVIRDIDQSFTNFIDEKATIHHLLTHTSGIFDYYDEEIVQDFDHFSVDIPWSKLTTPIDYFPLFVGQPFKFHAGERYAYSNGGYVFLGIIIEHITGQLYRDFIREQVLEVAWMSHSGFFAFNDLPENTAYGYLADRQTTNIYQLPLRGGGDGGMYTTAADLNSFWRCLFAGQILSTELTARFLQTHHQFNTNRGYGYGLYKQLDEQVFSISGSDAGVGFHSRYVVEQDVVINVLANVTDGENQIVQVISDLHSQFQDQS